MFSVRNRREKRRSHERDWYCSRRRRLYRVLTGRPLEKMNGGMGWREWEEFNCYVEGGGGECVTGLYLDGQSQVAKLGVVTNENM